MPPSALVNKRGCGGYSRNKQGASCTPADTVCQAGSTFVTNPSEHDRQGCKLVHREALKYVSAEEALSPALPLASTAASCARAAVAAAPGQGVAAVPFTAWCSSASEVATASLQSF